KNPHDLGPLLPSAKGFVRLTDSLPPSSSVTYRFVITYPGHYSFGLESASDRVAMSLIDDHGETHADDFGSLNAVLSPGEYRLRLANLSPESADVRTTINLATMAEQLAYNGVGQGPALDLRL